MADAEARQRVEQKLLADKEAELAREQRELDRAHEAELRQLQRRVEKARRDYGRAMERWQGSDGS